MGRKGLSQILYLIIAASVLMMVAMVVTFSATGILDDFRSQSTDTACQQAIEGQCSGASDFGASSNSVELPNSCIDRENDQFLTRGQVHNNRDDTGDLNTEIDGPDGNSRPFYVRCP
jgi:hypothetical protein